MKWKNYSNWLKKILIKKTMIELTRYLLETVLCFGMFYAFYRFVVEKENLLKFSRFYLFSTSVLSVIIPLIKFHSPVELFSLSRFSNVILIKLDQVTVYGGNTGSYGLMPISFYGFLLFIYISGIVISAVLFIIRLSRLFRFIRKNSAEHDGKYKYIFNKSGFLSFSFFNYIILGESPDMPAPDRSTILEHEKAHVDQRHSIDTMYFEILSVIFWFNPFVWLYRALIVDVHEYLADAAVVKKNGSEVYTRLLVQQALGITRMRLASYFRNSITLKRILKMKTCQKKSSNLAIAFFLPMVLLVFFFISCRNDSQKQKLIDEKAALENQKITSDSSSSEVYDKVDVMPEPSGGMNEYIAYLSKEIKYPEKAKKEGIEGKVLIEFIVDKAGTIGNVKVLQGFNDDCDKEAQRVVSSSGPWKPGIKDGKPVSVKMVMPISFKLN
jgi:TonB family protein